MLKGVSNDRQIDEMIRAAGGRALIDDAADTLEKAGVADKRNILSTLHAERIGSSDLVRISVRTNSVEHANIVSDVLAMAFIHQWEALGRGTGVIRIVQSQEIRGIDTVGSLANVFLIGWPILMILIGLEIGYLLGFLTAKRARGKHPESV
jgi:hypothetical protein